MKPPRLARWSEWISRSPPADLESLVRGLLIHYFFHVSRRDRVEVTGLAAGQHPSLRILSPTVFRGAGRIRVAASAVLGWTNSPLAYACSHYEARNPQAVIEIGEESTLNNAASLIAEGAGISIGRRCLIGTEFQALDTNAHELAVARRREADTRTRAVVVGDDVFIGSRVTLLKGVRIGNGCVIAAGAVVPTGFEAPPMSIVAGNPARVVGQVPPDERPTATALPGP